MTDRTKTRLAGGVAVFALALLAGCKQEPGGAVVATVNGDEITQRDLSAEMAANNIAPNADPKAVGPAVAAALVNRQLVLAEAKRTGLDKSPDYLAQSHRMQQTMLAQMMLERWSKDAPAPSESAINGFIAKHPELFSDRQVYEVAQVRFAPSGVDPKALSPLHSLDAVVGYLKQKNIPFQAGRTVLDSVQADPRLIAQMRKLPKGEPFVVPTSGGVIVSAVIGQRTVPIAGKEAQQLAEAALRREAIGEKLTQLRQGSTIKYGKGFEPPANAPTPAASDIAPAGLTPAAAASGAGQAQ